MEWKLLTTGLQDQTLQQQSSLWSYVFYVDKRERMIMFKGVVEALARVVTEVVKGLASAVLPLRSYRKRGGINENASVCGLFDSYRVRRVIARVSRRSSWGWGFP